MPQIMMRDPFHPDLLRPVRHALLALEDSPTSRLSGLSVSLRQGRAHALETGAAEPALIADATGLSKIAVQTALECLRRRELIETTSDHATAGPEHRVLRHWRSRELGTSLLMRLRLLADWVVHAACVLVALTRL